MIVQSQEEQARMAERLLRAVLSIDDMNERPFVLPMVKGRHADGTPMASVYSAQILESHFTQYPTAGSPQNFCLSVFSS